MAQKDIQEIANYMIQLNESKEAEDKAYEDALKEEQKFEAEEYDELDQDMIDPVTMGFIDDSNEYKESDSFYAENDKNDAMDEDVSDCIDDGKGCVDETEGFGTLTVQVYNVDGFGEYFIDDIVKTIPTISAKAKKNRMPNGDIVVEISGPYDELVKAFNFYIGKPIDAALVGNDKNEFDASLVFADGDTIAEADYREKVAHCLDPIGVNASTANLVKKDTCALSMIKEEKCKRKAAKMLKALSEDDFSFLSDDDLEQLDTIKDAVADGSVDSLTPEEAKIWNIVLDQMGYTPEEWDKMTPEQQEKAFKTNSANNPALSRTGFANYYQGVDPKDHSKKYRFTKAFSVRDPQTDDLVTTAFNPDYSADDSALQHPSMIKKQAKKQAQAEFDAKREAQRKDAMKAARGKDTWTKEDFVKMISTLTDKERKDIFKSLIADIEATAADPKQAANETMFIRNLFGKKPTLRNIAQAWDKSFPGVKLYADDVEAALYQAAREATGITWSDGALGKLEADENAKKKFIQRFDELMNSRKSRGKGMDMDPERAARKAEIKKAVDDAAKGI